MRLYKTQDLGYVRTMRNKAQKEVDELETRVIGITGQGRKVVWVDMDEQLEKRKEKKLEQHVDMDMDIKMDLDRDWESDEEGEVVKEEDLHMKRSRKLREREAEKLESKLDTAKKRLKALTEAEEALDLQRAKMGKSPTVGGVNKHGVKFKVRERKR